MIRNRKLILIFSLFIFIGAIHQVKFSITPLKDIPSMLSTMRAKEFCSCYFMLGKGEDYCLKSVLKGYPKFDFILNDEKKIVTFRNPVAEASSQVLDHKFGCILN